MSGDQLEFPFVPQALHDSFYSRMLYETRMDYAETHKLFYGEFKI